MKRVELKEFFALPAGTIYSYAGDLPIFRKGEAINDTEGRPIDFWELPISFANDEDGLRVEDCESRWGMFDESETFVVYEATDIELIVKTLTE